MQHSGKSHTFVELIELLDGSLQVFWTQHASSSESRSVSGVRYSAIYAPSCAVDIDLVLVEVTSLYLLETWTLPARFWHIPARNPIVILDVQFFNFGSPGTNNTAIQLPSPPATWVLSAISNILFFYCDTAHGYAHDMLAFCLSISSACCSSSLLIWRSFPSREASCSVYCRV